MSKNKLQRNASESLLSLKSQHRILILKEPPSLTDLCAQKIRIIDFLENVF